MLTAITEDSNFFSTCILHASAPAGRERSYTTVTRKDSVESMQSEEQPIISSHGDLSDEQVTAPVMRFAFDHNPFSARDH
jgi:hypothetical protein